MINCPVCHTLLYSLTLSKYQYQCDGSSHYFVYRDADIFSLLIYHNKTRYLVVRYGKTAYIKYNYPSDEIKIPIDSQIDYCQAKNVLQRFISLQAFS